MSFSSVVIWEQALFVAPFEHWAVSPLTLPLVYGSFLSCVHWWVLCSRTTICNLQVFSRLVLCLLDSSFFGLPGLSPLSPHSRSLPDFPVSPPSLLPRSSVKAIRRASAGAHPLFPVSQGSLVFIAWCTSGLMFHVFCLLLKLFISFWCFGVNL